ncbi:Mob1/phocein [Saccharata proteae CBS 121410]|uniref:Mob1/phocein n=1 Tax=Saccharata proteae CBS 121410 TaxID=1314787 RepID=A0A9P4LYZ8_9PEZI|nr:Mob1/phocein [Saccharata proteae CBS 121410]
MSPSSSPRLPSPPPIAEDQLGPMSPLGIGPEEPNTLASVDTGASRRIRPGTKAVDMAEGPPLIDSAFQLMEYLKALHYDATHPSDSVAIEPITRETAMRLATPPESIDRALWLYELCRFLTEHANSIVIALFADEPACSAQTCPEMRASEWQYLCAVHDPPKSCCAIDYCCHTLDWAANTLTSPKNFPSRLALGTEKEKANAQIRQLTNVFRRVYRIFAHAWFQHREMFWRVENKTGLYTFFKTVCDVYSLIPPDNYTIPPEAEGIDSTPVAQSQSPPAPMILKKEEKNESPNVEPAGNENIVTGNTTKRHRGTPSVSGPVTTVIEEQEEEEDPSANAAEKTVEVRDAAAEVHEAAKQGDVIVSEPSAAIVEHASDDSAQKAEEEAEEKAEDAGTQHEPEEASTDTAEHATPEESKPEESKPEESEHDDSKDAEPKSEESPAEEVTELNEEPAKEDQKADDGAKAEPMDPKQSEAASAEEAPKSVED